jgi:hypothetical protein
MSPNDWVFLPAVMFDHAGAVSVLTTASTGQFSLTAPLHRNAAATLLEGYELYCNPNWDCEGAEPIQKKTLEIAYELINRTLASFPLPDPAPGADGTIGFEWWNGRDYFFLDLGPGDEVRTLYEFGNSISKEEVFRWGDEKLNTQLELCLAKLYANTSSFAGTAKVFTANTFSVVSGSDRETLQAIRMSGSESSPIPTTFVTGDFTSAHFQVAA